MSVLRNLVTAGGRLAVTLMVPMIALQAQVVAPGTNPRSPTTNPAPTPTPNPAATPSQSLATDLPFLREAASANLLEIRLGQLALSKASNPAVKQFGQRMVTDHTTLNQQLTSMVSSNGIALNATLTPAQYATINSLQNLSGPQFDQAYMSRMIQDHQTDLTRFDNESRDANTPQVRDLAARTLPVLQQHLSLAQQVGSQVNAVAATTPAGKIPVPTQNGQVINSQSQADVRADSKFIHEVAADNLLEVRLADLAGRKAKSSAVKQFAERIASDYTKLQTDWVNIASLSDQRFKPGIGPNHRAKLDRLEKLSGRAFDRAYMTTEVQNHKDYIDYFEKEGMASRSSQVREMVRRELPILRTHFTDAKQVGAQVGANTAVTLRSERGSAKK